MELSTEVTCRFVAIEGTLAWAHDELIVEFQIRPPDGGRVAVATSVIFWGNYWDNWKEPRKATIELTGTLRPWSSHASTLVIDLDQPAPIGTLSLDLANPVVEYLFCSCDPKPLPDFLAPLIEWAEAEGIGLNSLPGSMPESMGWAQPWAQRRCPFVSRSPTGATCDQLIGHTGPHRCPQTGSDSDGPWARQCGAIAPGPGPRCEKHQGHEGDHAAARNDDHAWNVIWSTTVSVASPSTPPP